jgi:rod shape-determining protein MreC
VARTRRSRRTLTVIVLVIVSLSLISLDQNGRTHSLTSGIKSVANDVYAPLRQGVLDIISPIGNFFAGAFNYGSVQKQNQKLQAELGALRQATAQRPEADRLLRQITALEHLGYLGNTPTVLAQTTQINPSDFAGTITIDKGTADGVQLDNPVVGAGGLVGQVVQVFHHQATVRLLTDGASAVAVTFGSANNDIGTVMGQGTGKPLAVAGVSSQVTVPKRVTMFTSGLDQSAYPLGIPVAFVTSAHGVPGSTQQSVTAEPLADLDQLAYVAVVQWTTSVPTS